MPGCDDDIKVYRLVYDKEAWQNLIDAYKKYVFEGAYGISFDEANTYIASALDKEEDTERLADIDFDLDFYIGIDDGYVKAFHVEGTIDGEEGYLTAKLNGKDNIWDDVKIYTGDEPDSNIGLNFERNDGGIQLKFSLENSAHKKSYDYSVECKFSISIKPGCEIKPIENAINIFELSKKRLQNLFDELAASFEYQDDDYDYDYDYNCDYDGDYSFGYTSVH